MAAVRSTWHEGAMLFVTCIVPDSRDPGRAIDQIGGVDARGREWHLQLERAVTLARRGHAFTIRVGRRATRLEVVETDSGVDYLRAVGGGLRLADLPICTHSRHTPPDIDTPPIDEESPLFQNCRQAIAYLREHCPHLLPERLPAGEASQPIPVSRERAASILGIAIRQSVARAVGRDPASERDLPRAVVWTDGADELLVHLDTITVDTEDGRVTVGVDVSCDELAEREGRDDGRGTTRMLVDLVIGTAERPTGVLAAAPPPRGDALIARRWGDALVALAWRAMLDATAGIAAAAGSDEGGVPLVAFSWSSTPDGIAVAPRARHLSDRLSALASMR